MTDTEKIKAVTDYCGDHDCGEKCAIKGVCDQISEGFKNGFSACEEAYNIIATDTDVGNKQNEKENKTMAETMKPVYDLADTVAGMTSEDYKERFKAEYAQTKIRYEKLKAFNNRIEASERTSYYECPNKPPMPKHDCPNELLRQQQSVMGEYLHILEVRAVIEGIIL